MIRGILQFPRRKSLWPAQPGLEAELNDMGHALMRIGDTYSVKRKLTPFHEYKQTVNFNNILYNNPSYSRILIGSRLLSIRGQTHD